MILEPKARRLILLIFGLAALVFLILVANPRQVILHIATAQPLWIGVACLLILASTVLGAYNSYVITDAASARTFGSFIRGYWTAWAVGLVVPGQVGDVIALSVYLRRHGIALPLSLGRVGTDKLISLFCALLVATQLYTLSDQAWLLLPSLTAAILCALLVVLLVFVRLIEVRGTATRPRWQQTLLGALAEARELMIGRTSIVLMNFLLSTLKIGLTGLSYVAVLFAISGTAPSFAKVTIAAISAGLIAYLPLSSNGIGLVETAGTAVFESLGCTISTILAMYVILRFLNLLLAWLPVGLELLAAGLARRAE